MCKTCTLKSTKKWWDNLKTTQRHTPRSWNERFNVVKMAILCKLTYGFNAVIIETQAGGFYRNGPKKPEPFWIRIQIGKLLISDFKIYNNAAVLLMTAWYWCKDRYSGQWWAPCSTDFPHEVSVLGTHLYQCTS